MEEGDNVVSVAKLAEKDDDETGNAPERTDGRPPTTSQESYREVQPIPPPAAAPSRACGESRLYAGSSFANFASSFFWPTVLKRTVILKSSVCSSTARTSPTPNCACLTRMPGPRPPAAD